MTEPKPKPTEDEIFKARLAASIRSFLGDRASTRLDREQAKFEAELYDHDEVNNDDSR